MSGDRELARRVEALLPPDVSMKRYFGGWALRREDRQIAMVMDQLYVKVSPEVAAAWEEQGSEPFRYQAAGRTVVLESYLSVPVGALGGQPELAAVLAAADAGG